MLSYADIETPRVLATPTPTPGIGPLLREVWERYGLPVAVTEAHIDANREDQLRWLLEVWNAANRERRAGADVRAVTVWALLGSYDWNSLVSECKGYYEPGPFDVRGKAPRPTALAAMMRELASGRPLSHPVLQGSGWWRRPERLTVKPVAAPAADAMQAGRPFAAADDLVVSPTYVPDLVHACLDLLIDKEKGIWHLTNATPVAWYELAEMAAQAADVAAASLRQVPAARPAYSALGSERAVLLPSLSSALERYAALRADPSQYLAARSNQ